MKQISLEINGVLFDKLTVAENNQDMLEGFGHKTQIEANEGMVYVFDKDFDQSFLNANLHHALDIIMVDSQGKITAIHTMEKAIAIEGETADEFRKKLHHYSSPVPFRYVFEFTAGTAEKIGAKVEEYLDVDYSRLYPFRNAENIRYAFQLKKVPQKNGWIAPLLKRMEEITSSRDSVRDLNIEFVGGKHDLKTLQNSGWIKLEDIDTEESANVWMQKEVDVNDRHCCVRVCFSTEGHFRYLYILQLANDGAYLPVDDNYNLDDVVHIIGHDFVNSQIKAPPCSFEEELENVIWNLSNPSVKDEWDEWQKKCYIWNKEFPRLSEKSKYYGYRLLNGMLRFIYYNIRTYDFALIEPLCTAARLNYRWAAAHLVKLALNKFSDSQNPSFWNDLGFTLDHLNEKEAAFYCFANAWNLNFDSLYANNLWLMGNIIIPDLLEQQKWDSLFHVASVMLSAISNKATVKQQIEIMCIVGLIYEMRNDFEEAENYYNAAWDVHKRNNNKNKNFWALRWEFPMLYQALMRTRMKDKASCKEYIEAQLKTFPKTPMEYGYQDRLPVEYVEGDGHGDHWDSVTEDKLKDPEEFFGVMIQKGQLDAKGVELPEYERGEGLFTQGIGFRYLAEGDSASPIESYFLIGTPEKGDAHQFASAFPVFKKGYGSSIITKLDSINVWGNAVEATVEFCLRKGHNQLAFFLPDYCKESPRLKSATAYRVELGAFAYSVSRFEEQEFKIDKGFILEEEKLRLRKEGKDDNIDSVSIHMTDEFCNISRSFSGWADDISVTAPIEKIDKFTFLGEKCLILWVKFDERAEHITLPVFLKEQNLEDDYHPQIGDVINCSCWLQGWVHEEHSSVVAADIPEAEEDDDDDFDFDFEHSLLSGVRGTDHDLDSLIDRALINKGKAEEVCRCPEALPGDADFSCKINGSLKFVKVMTGFFETKDDYRKSWQDFCQQIPERPDGKKVYCLSIVGIKLYNDQNKIYYNGFSKLNPDVEKDEDELEDGFDLETTQKMADVIANAWRNLDVSEMRYILADDFEYTSQWVLETIYGADAYLEYLQSKFNNLSDSTKPTVAEIRCDESAIEIELEQVVDGSKNRVMLQLEIKDGEVIKGCMCHPSFRRIE